MCSFTAPCICLPLSPLLFPCVRILSERTCWLFVLGFRFSSSTEQSSSRLMRRHRRRRRKPKASNMDRVRADTLGVQHYRLKSSNLTKFTTVVSFFLLLLFLSLLSLMLLLSAVFIIQQHHRLHHVSEHHHRYSQHG